MQSMKVAAAPGLKRLSYQKHKGRIRNVVSPRVAASTSLAIDATDGRWPFQPKRRGYHA